MTHHRHPSRQAAHRVAVITVSDTRTPADDEGGDLVASLCAAGGHDVVERRIVPDNPERLKEAILALCDAARADAILLTGGTGISARDRTFEAVSGLLDRRLDGFGELFRMLSFSEIGAAAILSRAVAGLRGVVPIFAMPGSPKAVRLAMERLILPELDHIVSEARRST